MPIHTAPASTAQDLQLLRPTEPYLNAYIAALEQGWSADNVRGAAAAREEMAEIERDAIGFLAAMDDREALGAPVTLPDGSVAARIPSFRRWLWDGDFCGSINLRWQPGTGALPPHCLGHIGYAVVPWKQGRGHATRALALLLPEAAAVGLPFVELTTDPDNLASQRVIEANGGRLVERFVKPAQYGGVPGLRYRIDLL
jgi:predicted acetyltransferase